MGIAHTYNVLGSEEFDRSIMNFPNHDIDFHRHMSCSFMFNELRGNVIGCFDDVGGIFYQLCFLID
jgi:hypothetical protein